jgi:hypothetical protein
MRLFIDHVSHSCYQSPPQFSMALKLVQSKPKDDPEYNWVETTYDGKGDSEVIVVPAHWHWVRLLILGNHSLITAYRSSITTRPWRFWKGE